MAQQETGRVWTRRCTYISWAENRLNWASLGHGVFLGWLRMVKALGSLQRAELAVPRKTDVSPLREDEERWSMCKESCSKFDLVLENRGTCLAKI